MLIKSPHDGFNHAVSSEITPQAVYAQRRVLLKGVAAMAVGSGLASWAARDAFAQSAWVLAPASWPP